MPMHDPRADLFLVAPVIARYSDACLDALMDNGPRSPKAADALGKSSSTAASSEPSSSEAAGGPHRRRRRPAIRDIQIAAIETIPMTDEQYRDAVDALAVLIARWIEQHPQHQNPTTATEP
jgi:hypothetical protein